MKILNVVPIIIVLMIATFSSAAQAAPSITVKSRINSRGNTEWRVFVNPELASYSVTNGRAGTSLAVEVAFESSVNNFVSAVHNSQLWQHQIPGRNPFTNANFTGTYRVGRNAFTSMGSYFLIGPAPALLITLETQGTSPTTLTWGGRILLNGTTYQYTQARLAQAGANFNNVIGSLNSGVTPDSIGCESLRDQAYTYCNAAIDQPSNSTAYNYCGNRLSQAAVNCDGIYGNTWALCSDIGYLQLRACKTPTAYMCSLFSTSANSCRANLR